MTDGAPLPAEQRVPARIDGLHWRARHRARVLAGLALTTAAALGLFLACGTAAPGSPSRSSWQMRSSPARGGPAMVTERFELAVQRPVDADGVAQGLAALLGLRPSRVRVRPANASATNPTESPRLAISVAHERTSPVCALSVLGSTPRPALDAAIGATVVSGRPFCLSLLHVNDQHARMEPVNAKLNPWGSREDVASNATRYGGAAHVWGAMRARRAALEAAGRHALVLDVGDEFTGTAWFTYYGSEVTARVLRAAGLVDVMVLGNHEFDRGADGLALFLEQLDGAVRVRSHNVDVSRVPRLRRRRHADAFYPRGYHLVTRRHEGRDVRIAIVGVTTASTPESSSPGPDVIFREPIAALRALVPRLRAEHAVEHVIVLSHCGVVQDEQIAARVPGISAVVGGHSHTLIRHAINVTAAGRAEHGGAAGLGAFPASVPVVQARAYSRYIGELELCWPTRGPTAGRGAGGADGGPSVVATLEVTDLREGRFEPHPAVERALAEMAPAIVGFQNTVVGYAEADVPAVGCATADCAAGLLVAAAFLESEYAAAHGAHLALANAGGVRASFERGDVTEANVLTVQPFENRLVACELSGATVLAALEYGLSALRYDPSTRSHYADGPAGSPGAFPQLAGVQLSFDPRRPPGSRVLSATLTRTAEPITPSSTLVLVTIAYLLRGGDGYDDLSEGCAAPLEDGPTDASALTEYWRRHSPLDPGRDLPGATHAELSAEAPPSPRAAEKAWGTAARARAPSAWGGRGLEEDSTAPTRGAEGASYATRAAREANEAEAASLAAAELGGGQPCVIGAWRGAATWARCGAEPGHVLGSLGVDRMPLGIGPAAMTESAEVREQMIE